MSTTIGGVTFDWTWQHALADGQRADGKPVNRVLPLRATRDGAYYELASPNVSLIATVKSDDCPDTSRFRAGFSQTIYYSTRSYYYFSSLRTVVSEALNQTPVWDGDEDDPPPWFGFEPDEYDDDDHVWRTNFCDSPSCMALSESPIAQLSAAKFGWECDPRAPGEKKTLFFIGGADSFAAFLCIEDQQTSTIHPVDHVAWHVAYAAVVDAVRGTIRAVGAAGTYVGQQGRNYNGQPQLQGQSAEFHNRAVYTRWTPNSLPVEALQWLRFERVV